MNDNDDYDYDDMDMLMMIREVQIWTIKMSDEDSKHHL